MQMKKDTCARYPFFHILLQHHLLKSLGAGTGANGLRF